MNALRIFPVTFAILLVQAASDVAQTTQPDASPDPAAILDRALAVHRGPRPHTPRTLWFKGSVERRSKEGDRNEAEVEVWFESRDARTIILTRIEVPGLSGRPEVTIRGFDGKRYFVRVNGKKVIISGNPTYKEDEAAIKRDLSLTRFLIDNFMAGRLRGDGANLEYLARTTGHGMASHKIARKDGKGVTIIYYVNDTPGQEPWFNGIEFPREGDRPQYNYCFSHLKSFGRFRVFQEIRIHENNSAKPRTKVWITKLKVDAAERPKWVR
jgi:hypothetical protein